MSWAVYTTDGATVNKPEKTPLSEAEATADAKTRNAQAEGLGIQTRYEAREVQA